MSQSFFQGRQPVLFALALVAAVFAARYIATGTAHQAWGSLVVGATSPGFADLRTITHSIDCLLNGHDPYLLRLCDPWGRLYNYPSIWLYLGKLGIGSASTDIIGVMLIVLMVTSLLLLFRTQTLVSGILVSLAVCSPPILFAMERGNTDLFIFSLLILFCTLLSQIPAKPQYWGMACLIIVLTLIKIYPIAIACAFAQGKKYYLSILVGCIAIVLLFMTAGSQELSTIAANTPQCTWFSYGGLRIFLAAANGWSLPFEEVDGKLGSFAFDLGAGLFRQPVPLTAQHLRVVAGAVTLSVGAGAMYVALRRPEFVTNFVAELDRRSAGGAIAISCLAIFCATFMLGTNFDYRLVFLLGVLSALLQYYDIKRQRSLLIVPGAIVIFLWLSRSPTGVFPFLLAELFDWMLFAGGIAWLAISLLAKADSAHIEAYPA